MSELGSHWIKFVSEKQSLLKYPQQRHRILAFYLAFPQGPAMKGKPLLSMIAQLSHTLLAIPDIKVRFSFQKLPSLVLGPSSGDKQTNAGPSSKRYPLTWLRTPILSCLFIFRPKCPNSFICSSIAWTPDASRCFRILWPSSRVLYRWSPSLELSAFL